ncbi:MAG: hypothetical protein R6U32_01705 [Candidatus Woesearchaeota archaeon]
MEYRPFIKFLYFPVLLPDEGGLNGTKKHLNMCRIFQAMAGGFHISDDIWIYPAF